MSLVEGGFIYDADAGQFRYEAGSKVRSQFGETKKVGGQFADPNDVVRFGNIQQDEHGFRFKGKFIPAEALIQKSASQERPIEEQANFGQRLVYRDASGRLRQIRAGGPDQRTLNRGVASAGIERGLLEEGEYITPQQASTLVRERSIIVQNLDEL
jgi:hypothetical protein